MNPCHLNVSGFLSQLAKPVATFHVLSRDVLCLRGQIEQAICMTVILTNSVYAVLDSPISRLVCSPTCMHVCTALSSVVAVMCILVFQTGDAHVRI